MSADGMFLPAPFELLEFDDADRDDARGARRVLVHVNGLVTGPAEQVLLGWVGATGSEVVVATRRGSGAWSRESTGRWDAAYIGTNPPLAGTEESLLSVAAWRDLEATVEDGDDRWRPVEVVVDGRPARGEVVAIGSGSVGWFGCGDRVVSFALRDVPIAELRCRTVRPATSDRYPCDPLMPRTYTEFLACAAR